MDFCRKCLTHYAGIVPYDLGLRLQNKLFQEKLNNNTLDVLLLLQHEPVITVGRFKGGDEICVKSETLQQAGIPVFHTNRGGGATFHNPGQLVGYPVINIKENKIGVYQYVWKLEQVVINLLLSLGLQGRRIDNYPGVWVGTKKICSIGIHISHHISIHGFALNVCNNLSDFKYIKPCGMDSGIITSISELTGDKIEIENIIHPLFREFMNEFGMESLQGDHTCLNILDDLTG